MYSIDINKRENMKAAQLTAYGEKDVLKTIDDAPKPTIQADQVLVEVAAAGVNPFDITVREGRAREMAELDLPATLGGDFAGTIAQVGAKVTGFEVGQAVYGQAGALSGNGSFAEFTPVKTNQLAFQPSGLDAVSAAALPLVSVSAYQALVDHMHLEPGQKILIHGGAGGIGLMAIQIAKNIGAYVATTVRGSDADFVRGLGADEVIDYTIQDFTSLIKDYDAVFDTVGGDTNTKSYGVLKRGGAFVAMLAPPNEELVAKYDIEYMAQYTMVTTEKLTKIAELVQAGKLKINVDKVFPLDQAAEALEYLGSGHPRGKVVLKIK